MKNNVQAYIAVVSFPTSIEELRYFTDSDYYMDMEEIMLGHDVNYTAPKWAAKGDIIFFYHAKSAIVKIRSLKKQAVGQKDEDKLMEYIDLAEKIYKACGGSIFCVARVGDNPEIIKDDRENLHWRGDIYAIINKTAHKCYIGSCQDLRYRASAHLSMLKHGKHHSKEMQEDYNNNHKFEFVVLCETRQEQWYNDDRKCLEDYFISCMKARDIELYNSPNHGLYEKNFFYRASWLDERVIGLRNKVLFEK